MFYWGAYGRQGLAVTKSLLLFAYIKAYSKWFGSSHHGLVPELHGDRVRVAGAGQLAKPAAKPGHVGLGEPESNYGLG